MGRQRLCFRCSRSLSPSNRCRWRPIDACGSWLTRLPPRHPPESSPFSPAVSVELETDAVPQDRADSTAMKSCLIFGLHHLAQNIDRCGVGDELHPGVPSCNWTTRFGVHRVMELHVLKEFAEWPQRATCHHRGDDLKEPNDPADNRRRSRCHPGQAMLEGPELERAMSDMEMDESIIKEFLIESYKNLDQLDRDLVALEKDPTDRETLASVFRNHERNHQSDGRCGARH